MSNRLQWRWDNESDTLQAPSIYHDEGQPLPYAIEIGEVCVAYFEGEVLKEGTLEECMSACTEDDAQHDWIYEDELPDWYDYAANFPNSKVVDGVRMFPRNRGDK